MTADASSANCYRVENTFKESVDQHVPYQKSAFVGGLQCKQLEEGGPVKLSWVPKNTSAELSGPQRPENAELMNPLQQDQCAGMPSQHSIGRMRDSPLMLPWSILSSAAKNTDIDDIEPGQLMEQAEVVTKSSSTDEGAMQEVVQVGLASRPALRRNRRARTEVMFSPNDLIAAETDMEDIGASHVGGMFPMLPPPGLCPPPGTPSHGSVLHNLGSCRPCAWHWKEGGCKNGSQCRHCHLCPQGEAKIRRKAKLTQMRLGLATPKAALYNGHATAFFPSPFGSELPMNIEPDESTTCASSEQDLPSGPSSEDDLTAGPNKMRNGNINSAEIPASIAQANDAQQEQQEPRELQELPDQQEQEQQSFCSPSTSDLAFVIPGDTKQELPGCFEGIQRKSRRTRTEPIKLRWGGLEDVVHIYADDKESEDDDDGAMLEPLAPPPGLRPLQGTSSIGSALHHSGECRPCAWYWKPGSCQNGRDCMHCHLCPDGEIRNRKKAKNALRLSDATPKSCKLSAASAN